MRSWPTIFAAFALLLPLDNTKLFVYLCRNLETVGESASDIKSVFNFVLRFFLLDIFRSDKYWASYIRGCVSALMFLQIKVSRRGFSVSYGHEKMW